MIYCACLIALWAKCFTDNPKWHSFVERHIVADDPWDELRNGPWGRRPEDPDEWARDEPGPDEVSSGDERPGTSEYH